MKKKPPFLKELMIRRCENVETKDSYWTGELVTI